MFTIIQYLKDQEDKENLADKVLGGKHSYKTCMWQDDIV